MFDRDIERLKVLIGQTIDSILIDRDVDDIDPDDNELIQISYNQGQQLVYLKAGYECHLQTHWESIEGKDALKDTPVTNVYLTDEVYTDPDPLEEDNGDVYQAIVFETLKGRCQIEMRTANEQYYGLAFDTILPGDSHSNQKYLYGLVNSKKRNWVDFKEK